jgi:hypothetical protein
VKERKEKRNMVKKKMDGIYMILSPAKKLKKKKKGH